MLDVISPVYLLAIGIFLVGLEVLTLSFVIFFIGIGSIVVAAISLVYPFESGMAQVALSFLVAFASTYALRDLMLKKLSKVSTVVEKKAHVSGMGYIEDGSVKFNGTYWKTLNDISSYKNGDTVEIISVEGNMVVLKG